MAVSPIPAGYHALVPYLSIDGAAKAIDFYCQILGGTVAMRIDGPDGRVGHAEIKLGDSTIMLSDSCPGMGNKSPVELGGSPVGLMLYVPDVDTVFRKAIAAGSTEVKSVQDQFYGDRSGTFSDPFGHIWTVATHIEDVEPAEMQRRAIAAMSGNKGDAK